MPGNRVRPWLRPPDRLGGGGGSLPSRIRHLAPGQAILGRARPVEKIAILARQRPLFLGVSSGIGPQPHDDGCELRDAGGQILPSPRRRSRRIDFVEDVAMRCVERISAAPRFSRDSRRGDPDLPGVLSMPALATHQSCQGRPIGAGGCVGLRTAPRRRLTRPRHPGPPAGSARRRTGRSPRRARRASEAPRRPSAPDCGSAGRASRGHAAPPPPCSRK